MAEQRSIYEAVLGTYDPHDRWGTMTSAMQVLTEEPWTPIQLAAEHDRIIAQYSVREGSVVRMNSDQLPPLEQDRYRSISQLKGVILEGHTELSHGLTDWVTYEQTFKQHGRRLQGGTSLLLGALSPLTTRAFQVLSTEVYGADRPAAIDISPGVDRQKHLTFLQADALRLPFRDESIDLVQVSNLLHMLEDPSGVAGSTVEENMERLYAEASRVLRPAGQLIMKEMAPDQDYSSPLAAVMSQVQARERFETVLRRCGFGRIATADTLLSRSTAYLFDPAFRTHLPEEAVPSNMYAVYASKTIAL